MAAATANTQKSHYPPAALKTSKSLGKTAKALEAQEVLKKKQVGFIFYVCGYQRVRSVVSFTLFFLFFCLPGGIKAPAGHEEEEAGDVKDTD